MPITDKYENTPVTDIRVDRASRQRHEVVTKGLIDSIAKYGILNPIIITQDNWLVAGERRLACAIELGRATVPTRFYSNLSAVEAQIIELEENIKRSDLDWPDLVRGIGKIHWAHIGIDGDWTMGETADSISVSLQLVSQYLKVYPFLNDERIAASETFREAYNTLGRRDQRAAGDALEELVGVTTALDTDTATGPHMVVEDGKLVERPWPKATPRIDPVNEAILYEDFRRWAPKYSGPKFNVVHCDFPYGIEVFSGPQMYRSADTGEDYPDGLKVYLELLECLLVNLNRVMAVSGHLMFWYSGKNHQVTMEAFGRLAPGLKFTPFPLVWVKSDNAGIAADVRMGPRHIYETCLLASRGNRQIVRVVSDAYSAPTDKTLHVSTKPVPMLKYFMQMLVDENTSLLDPTCGSAASLHAAEQLGAKRVLGMDVDEKTVGVARVALKVERGKRAASRAIGSQS